MKLVEVIPGLDTSRDTIQKTMDITGEIGKEPILTADRAGFVVNRLLFAFFNEAWRMVDEGVARAEIHHGNTSSWLRRNGRRNIKR